MAGLSHMMELEKQMKMLLKYQSVRRCLPARLFEFHMYFWFSRTLQILHLGLQTPYY